MPIIRWEPLEAVDRFFSDHPLKIPKLGWDLAVDLFEENGTVVAKMSLPGVEVGDLSVSVDKDTLTVSGVRNEEKEIDEKEYYSKEIRRGSFSRTVELPKEVDPGKASADYKNGILRVVVPIVETTNKGSVQVSVGT